MPNFITHCTFGPCVKNYVKYLLMKIFNLKRGICAIDNILVRFNAPHTNYGFSGNYYYSFAKPSKKISFQPHIFIKLRS